MVRILLSKPRKMQLKARENKNKVAVYTTTSDRRGKINLLKFKTNGYGWGFEVTRLFQ